jgi:hypothetical protein
MRPDENDSPAGGTGDSLAGGRGDVSTSTDPFGDDSYDVDVFEDDTYGDDTYGDDTYSEGADDVDVEVGEDDDGFGDGSTVPADDDTGILVPEGPDTVPEVEDSVPGGELDLEGHQNDPLEGVGYLIEELREALLGEDGDVDDLAGPSPFDADPADVASDTDLDLTGDGLVDGHDLDEAHSVLDFDVSDG